MTDSMEATVKPILLCVPFAGAGASFYRPWQDLDDGGVQVRPVNLPGRERRIAEEPFRDVHQAASGLSAELVDSLREESRPLALFGHSLGAVLAFELTRRLNAAGCQVDHLFVSGSARPDHVRRDRATGLDDEEFLNKVEELAGYRHEVLDDPEMRELILPVLRADVEMHENYVPQDLAPLPTPITAIRGRDDDLVSHGDLLGWTDLTSGSFQARGMPGGHMYLTDAAREVLKLVAASFTSVAASH